MAETALVVGTEVFSRLLDWTDRSTCVLFGDGAGAVVLRRTDGAGGCAGLSWDPTAAAATCSRSPRQGIVPALTRPT